VATLNDLANPQYRAPVGPSCTIGILLKELDKDTAASLTAAMQNPHAPATKISQALKDMGKPASAHVIQRHRRGECRCARES
jgi:hypothetical protein